jgi:hypothetical protein
MRRILFVLLLTFICNAAMADWTPVTSNDSLTAYADPKTIRQTGNIVSMWGLIQINSADIYNGSPYISTKTLVEYNCSEMTKRLTFVSYHSGIMGGGNTVGSESNKLNWAPVDPGSAYELLWKIACGKR